MVCVPGIWFLKDRKYFLPWKRPSGPKCKLSQAGRGEALVDRMLLSPGHVPVVLNGAKLCYFPWGMALTMKTVCTVHFDKSGGVLFEAVLIVCGR